MAWTAITLQRLAGDDVSFFDVRALEAGAASEIVFECHHPQPGMLAGRLALRQLNTLRVGEQTNAELEIGLTKRMTVTSGSRRPSPDVDRLLDAARARGIPVTSIDPRGRIYELGHGIYRRRLFNTTTSNTSAIGAHIAGDKFLSMHFLREMGLPVPDTGIAPTEERAVALAQEIGYPVVVKPIDGGDAVGVHIDVRNDDEVRSAFAHAAAMSQSRTVVVQQYLVGREYRFLVVGDQVVGMVARVPAHVIGDGSHTVRELVERENANPARGQRKVDRLKTIELGDKTLHMLERQGLTLDDVPADGAWVQLNATGHISAGGAATEMTDAVHPDNAAIVIAAARALEVDIAGIDVIADDIERSIWETSGGIVEVNCGPGVWIHLYPSAGADIDPGPAVIETLFPSGAPVRVPLVAVTGPKETGEISRLIGRLLTASGRHPGLAVEGALFVGETRLGGMDGSGLAGKRRVLLNPAVEMAVLEIPPEEIVTEGLAFEVCDVAVVTGLSGASPVGLPEAESVVCRLVRPEGAIVVAAGDAEAVELARSYCPSVVYYGVEADGAGRRSGDRAVWWRETQDAGVLTIEWTDRDSDQVTVTSETGVSGRALAAAVAAVLALNIPRETIRQAMETAGIAAVAG
jgi:cyanophycin synthetase